MEVEMCKLGIRGSEVEQLKDLAVGYLGGLRVKPPKFNFYC